MENIVNTTEVRINGNKDTAFQALYPYEIKNLCETMVRALLESNKPDEKNLKEKYYNEYANKYGRFNSSIEFCLHELGMAIKDPLSLGNGEVLISNGNRLYIVSAETFNNPNFDIKQINREDIGYPKLNDDNIVYDPTLTNFDMMKQGVVTNDGYLDASFAGSINALGELLVMDTIFSNKEMYEGYQATKRLYDNALAWILAQPDVIKVSRGTDNRILVEYVSENGERITNFLNNLAAQDLLSDNVPAVVGENDLMVQKKAA